MWRAVPTASAGTAGFDAGNNRVTWTGNIAAGATVRITFDVTVNSGILLGTVIRNQGTVQYDSDGDGTPDASEPTDGDTSNPGNQSTTVPVGGTPEGLAIKSASDVNGGNLEPGDVVLYTIRLQNSSGFNAVGLEFVDNIPTNTVYVANSVSAPASSTVITTTPTLRIRGIDVAARSQVFISFRVRLVNPMPAGVTEIINQGTVNFDTDGDGINDSSQLTDGDTTQPGNQPTVLPLTAGPNYGTTTKSVVLTADADGNGAVSPGDTLRYTIQIPNTGNQDSLGVVFLLDQIPANTTYVAGSATASAGTAGFDAGNNRVTWTGNIAAGATVRITFDVTVNSGILPGITIANQGTVQYDSNGDGTPDASEPTDGDTSNPGNQPTTVTVGRRARRRGAEECHRRQRR